MFVPHLTFADSTCMIWCWVIGIKVKEKYKGKSGWANLEKKQKPGDRSKSSVYLNSGEKILPTKKNICTKDG